MTDDDRVPAVSGLELGSREAQLLSEAVLAIVDRFDDDATTASKVPFAEVKLEVQRISAPPPEAAGELEEILSLALESGVHAANTSGPRCFQQIPGSSLLSSALAELLARVFNRHSAFADQAPLLTAMEQGVIRWLCSEFGFPATGGGVVTSGGSFSTLIGLAAARIDRLGDEWSSARVYLSPFTHGSVAKDLRIMGFRREQLRLVAADPGGRMELSALSEAIDTDKRAGATPFLVVGTAGSTDLGAIDPLAGIAEIASRTGCWFHVDAAYGGFFQLTSRGRAALSGVERADSLVLDPHKSLFMPFGTGVLLVRDEQVLRSAYGVEGAYLAAHATPYPLPNRAELSPELTTEPRGLRLWLPLQLHGVAAFRDALDEKLDLASHAFSMLSTEPRLEVVAPELSTVVFSVRGDDEATSRLLAKVNASGAGTVSGTVIAGRTVVRLCILNYRTHMEQLTPMLEVILREVQRL